MPESDLFPGVSVQCCMGNDGCVCGANERVLRAYVREESGLAPMSPAQREWCLSEIADVEGYTRSDFDGECDGGLARGVLSAWTDFCRDKGLL